MGWILDARNSHQKNEVGRVTSGHEHTLSLRGLVNRAVIALEGLELCGLAWLKQHHWTLCEENFRITLIQGLDLRIPFGSLNVHSDNIDTIFGSIDVLLIINNGVIESKEIDSDTILSCIVLLSTCQETLSEEESGDPEHFRKSIVSPIREPLESSQEIFHVSSKSLQ
jgi:hypothetical protein